MHGSAPKIPYGGKATAIFGLILGILTVFLFAWRPVLARFADGSKAAVAGALLASLNTASEYGFGGVIALLPGFKSVSAALSAIPIRWSMKPSR